MTNLYHYAYFHALGEPGCVAAAAMAFSGEEKEKRKSGPESALRFF
jgi:hypothetical protein